MSAPFLPRIYIHSIASLKTTELHDGAKAGEV